MQSSSASPFCANSPIAASGEMRLYSLRKRMENSIEGEFYNLAALEGWRGVDVDVIADIKQVAIDEHRAAWDVMEQAAREFLRRRKPMKKET